ncbi:hypothetical protein ACLOJK_022622 [Asimina triloba]
MEASDCCPVARWGRCDGRDSAGWGERFGVAGRRCLAGELGRRWCSSGASGRRCWLGRKGWPARDEWAAIVSGDDRPGETRTGGGYHDRICHLWRWICRGRRLPSDLL